LGGFDRLTAGRSVPSGWGPSRTPRRESPTPKDSVFSPLEWIKETDRPKAWIIPSSLFLKTPVLPVERHRRDPTGNTGGVIPAVSGLVPRDPGPYLMVE